MSSIGLHWAVVDPRRHILYVWDKDQDDFLKAAFTLGASVFTNGSFNQYKGGNKVVATLKVARDTAYNSGWKKTLYFFLRVTGKKVPIIPSYEFSIAKNYADAAKKHWQGHKPDGNIFGNHESIAVIGKHKRFHHYFGRKQGRFFGDYEINQGTPGGTKLNSKGKPHSSAVSGGLSEVIGGLFRTVRNYTAVDPQSSGIGAGHWGLAPLVSSGSAVDDWQLEPLNEARIDRALAEYAKNEKKYRSDDPSRYLPPANNAPACTGLLITVFYWGDVQTVAQRLVDARVKEAVRVDGNASILLGHHATAVVGVNMPEWKRMYNKWGFQCQPG